MVSNVGMKRNSLPSILIGLGSRNGSADTDAELLSRFVADRDQDAFAELVHRYTRLVWRVARTRCRNETTAEDVFQAAFVVLTRKASSIRSGDALAGWLHRTAHRLALKAARKERPVDPLPSQLSTLSTPTDPLDALTARELLAVVDEVLAKLSDADRSVLLLCGIDGLANDDAARRLGITTGAVKGRLERARVKLRNRLDARGLTLPALVIGLVGHSPPASAIQAALAIPFTGPAAFAIEQLITEGLTMKSTITKAGIILAMCAVVATVGGWGGNGDAQPKVNAAPVPKELRRTIQLEAWGEVREGLQAGLRMPGGTTVEAGQSAEMQVVVRNVSREPISIAYTPQGTGIFVVGVNQNGTVALFWSCVVNGNIPSPQEVWLGAGGESIRWKMLVRHNPPDDKLDPATSRIDLPAGRYQFVMKQIGGDLFDFSQIFVPEVPPLKKPFESQFPSVQQIDRLGTGTLEVTLPEPTK